VDIHLHSDSVVNSRTGEVSAPSEYQENLRAVERTIQRLDDDIVQHKADLKMARDAREKAVAALRSAVREGTVLPLLEANHDEDDGDAAEAVV
jgi:hypothetical protein